MFNKKVNEKLDSINEKLKKIQAIEISYILGNKKEIIKRNLIAGIARGVGIGIGITIISAVIIYFLQRLIRLNIPVVGDYIGDIVSIVQKSL